jgi:hypothetical protein
MSIPSEFELAPKTDALRMDPKTQNGEFIKNVCYGFD